MESGEDDQTPSAPWERPARWEDESAETTGRRHRWDDAAANVDDGTSVPASELIAALSARLAAGQAGDSGEAGGSAEAVETGLAGETAGVGETAGAGETSEIAEAGETVGPGADFAPAVRAGRAGRGWLNSGRALAAALAVMLLLVAGTEWVIKARADAVLSSNQISALDTDDVNISPPPPPTTGASPAASAAPVAEKHYQSENILILGSDSRSSSEDAALGGANKDPGGSDVVMVAHLSGDRSHVTVVSIPRDTYVNAPECKAWDHVTNSQTDRDYTSPFSIWRINSTYAAGGAPCTVKAVQEMTGLRIDRVIIIDFAGFAAIVDAQGGIDVNACMPIIDGQLGTVLPQAGIQHIDGKQALNLVRARKVEGDTTSDLARIRRQQKVLSTILRQATSTGVLLNPITLNNVLQAFVHNVKTDNVTLDNLLDIAQSLGNLDPRRVTFYTLPTVPDSDGIGLHETDGAALIWQALRHDTLLPGEMTEPPATPSRTNRTTTPTTPMTTVTQPPVTSLVTSLVTSTPTVPQSVSIAPRDVDLQVVNVAGRAGVANAARDALQSVGYRIPSNAMLRPEGDVAPGISIEYSAPNRAAALTVAATVPGASLVQKSDLGSQVRLMLGTAFNAPAFTASLRAAAVGDPLPPALSTAAAPITETVTSTVVSTPAPVVMPMPAPSTSQTPSTPQTPDPSQTTELTIASSEITSVNAGTAGCI